MAGGYANFKVEVKGLKAAKAAFKEIGDKEAPFLRPAFQAAGSVVGGALVMAAPVSVGAKVDVMGKGANSSARVTIGKHPALKSFQWGRKKYYRGYTGRNVRSGQTFNSSPGFQARPFLIQTMDSKADTVSEILRDAYEQEFSRVVARGD